MDKLRQIIREVIQQRNLKPDCGCGCNGKCAEEKAPMINENLSRKPLLSEHLQYHVDNKKPLTENTFRYEIVINTPTPPTRLGLSLLLPDKPPAESGKHDHSQRH